MRDTYLGPVRCGPPRWTLLRGAGLLVCRDLRWTKGVGQFQDAAIRQPLFAQDPPPLKSTATAPGALHSQRQHRDVRTGSALVRGTFQESSCTWPQSCKSHIGGQSKRLQAWTGLGLGF